MEVLIIL